MRKAQFLKGNLQPGEVYAGLILGQGGEKDYHLILLPQTVPSTTWQRVKAWAKSVGGSLPDRRELHLLRANAKQGLFRKYNVNRVDGSDQPGGKHHGDEYFVLDLTTDKHAWPAISAYAESCAAEYPALAADLLAKLIEHTGALSEFVTVPETTLPDGTVVPAFRVVRYLAAQSPGGMRKMGQRVEVIDSLEGVDEALR